MSLGGSYQDFHLEMFKDMLEDELQQMGSVLEQTVTMEMVDGLKTFFHKTGKATSYEKTARNMPKQWSDATYEKRELTFQWIESDELVDPQDVLNMVRNPQDDRVRNMVAEIGRETDRVIEEALVGNAVVITNGSSSNQALSITTPIDNTIAVNDHTYDSGSGDVALTPSKLKLALARLAGGHVDLAREQIFCVGKAAQLMALKADGNTEVTSGDFRTTKPLEGPGVVSGLNGYLGITGFIAYEEFDVDGNSDDLVYVYAKSAVKVGVRQALSVTADRQTQLAGNPIGLSAFKDLGAVRMYEEKVIQIACNPVA